jgi:hypothetical protein
MFFVVFLAMLRIFQHLQTPAMGFPEVALRKTDVRQAETSRQNFIPFSKSHPKSIHMFSEHKQILGLYWD